MSEIERLRAAIADEIRWHGCESRQLRNAAADLKDEAPDEAWECEHDAALHEDAAARLQAILYPAAPAEPEIAF
jgi:hypothetical protein